MAIRVAVAGAAGRMGQTVCAAVEDAEGLELAGRADPALGTSVADVLGDADVLVDFTQPDQAARNAQEALAAGVHVVIGTSGFDQDVVRDAAAASDAKAFFAPNFAVGAVLMMQFARQAARFFESVEVIELHHAGKVDAPSGTAVRTAALLAEARAKAGRGKAPDATSREVPGARGADVDGVRVHAVRLPGLVAHQEVLLGAEGETLTIRHDATNRTSFMPGVLLAVRGVRDRPGLTVGLEALLGLDDPANR
jgi:4-hydroxy-tetrahydrodipicolinate reductase